MVASRSLTFAAWKHDLIGRLKDLGVPAKPDDTWRQFYRQGYTPEMVASIEQEHFQAAEAMDLDD